jgi:hypothetical protein
MLVILAIWCFNAPPSHATTLSMRSVAQGGNVGLLISVSSHDWEEAAAIGEYDVGIPRGWAEPQAAADDLSAL